MLIFLKAGSRNRTHVAGLQIRCMATLPYRQAPGPGLEPGLTD